MMPKNKLVSIAEYEVKLYLFSKLIIYTTYYIIIYTVYTF